ncbi:MAG: magnesium protoporphyrin IX methyltransferase [Paracoccaceae bacterium]|nr:magnesium protoporphyrin IX methyltransferase [Paracoccaceae bacterium]
MTTYSSTRDRLEAYFDQTATQTWERLTSDAPVSRIRQTVREGRDRMRALMLSRLPADLNGARVLDAGCGAGQTSVELAARGAEVVAVDIAPNLLEVAARRTPAALAPRITFRPGDMLDEGLGRFDYVIAMDSLIHYRAPDIADALLRLGHRTSGAIVFTLAPRTPLLRLMHLTGKAFPRANRSPAIVPHRAEAIAAALAPRAPDWALAPVGRVACGFYISQAMELRP